MSEASPRAHYEAWLGKRAAATDIQTGPDLGNPTYALFQVRGGPPSGPRLEGAAASVSAVVVLDKGEGWADFLRSAPPKVIQGQIGWLNGAWASHSPTSPQSKQVMVDPKVQKYLADPKLEERPDGVLIFEAYYGEPPSFDPVRYRVRVGTDGRASFSADPVWKLP